MWCCWYLHLPEGLGAGGRGGRLPQRGSQEDVLLLLVVVAGQKLLLLGVKQPHHVSLVEAKAISVQTAELNHEQLWGRQHRVQRCDARLKATYPLQNIFPVVAELHEQGHLPAGVAVDRVDLQQVDIARHEGFQQTV